ncbi:YdeI/OmpD-associated family protein [Pontibacter akesuensis]|uniref:Bacteriocin-protection, YdeI or OmpD-Associated n=1 Tax=Pontibacter akesuensis TaxID=388950 RepID=A0A1I7I991_9BACT|nr:YdeI/OmpD-associated family protein [Pontibacter akesuensis]GHA65847.1 hypothetical protein GCM10007389_18510 [Pontibacter akesuensis]SFU69376.1 Bacteriocin-protection, YdeI or OmpD-Associated [Pontibacter akesuensis]
MVDLGKKLQIKAGQKLLLRNAPEQVAQTLTQEGYTPVRHEKDAALPAAGYGAALAFATHAAELAELVAQVLPLLQPQGIFWVAYPKKTSGVKTDLTRDKGWRVLAEQGYEAVRQIAVDEVWSAVRFRQQSERKEASTFGVDMPGIDRKTKTVAIPDDLRAALQEVELLKNFERLAFTHRKEYVVAVLEAKRPETRASRVAKAVEGVAKLAAKQV